MDCAAESWDILPFWDILPSANLWDQIIQNEIIELLFKRVHFNASIKFSSDFGSKNIDTMLGTSDNFFVQYELGTK